MKQSLALPADLTVFERGWLSSNNILFTGRDATALVDSGYDTHSDQTLALVRRVLSGRPLELLANTHLHSDHCGGNAALQAAYPGLVTLIPPGQAAQVRDWDPEALMYAPLGQRCTRFRFDDVLAPGRKVGLGDHAWQVHAAPGHDPHSVVLFEPASRTLISADALWENGFGVVFPELEGEQGFDQVAATLDLIESLQPRAVIPGHGAPFSTVAMSLGRARSRLNGFAQNPKKHAAHAAKVLLKFKLLELQRVPLADFSRWADGTRYFGLLQRRHFAGASATEWVGGLVEELVRAGVAERQGETLLNRG